MRWTDTCLFIDSVLTDYELSIRAMNSDWTGEKGRKSRIGIREDLARKHSIKHFRNWKGQLIVTAAIGKLLKILELPMADNTLWIDLYELPANGLFTAQEMSERLQPTVIYLDLDTRSEYQSFEESLYLYHIKSSFSMANGNLRTISGPRYEVRKFLRSWRHHGAIFYAGGHDTPFAAKQALDILRYQK